MKALFDELCVGATIWRYNVNKRRYVEGSAANQVTERERFEPVAITGETKVSWLVKNYSTDDKIPKDSSKWNDGFFRCGSNFPRLYALSEKAIDDRCWHTENRHWIQERVGQATISELREIAKIIGYEE